MWLERLKLLQHDHVERFCTSQFMSNGRTYSVLFVGGKLSVEVGGMDGQVACLTFMPSFQSFVFLLWAFSDLQPNYKAYKFELNCSCSQVCFACQDADERHQQLSRGWIEIPPRLAQWSMLHFDIWTDRTFFRTFYLCLCPCSCPRHIWPRSRVNVFKNTHKPQSVPNLN